MVASLVDTFHHLSLASFGENKSYIEMLMAQPIFVNFAIPCNPLLKLQ